MNKMKYYFDPSKPPINYRPGTSDEAIIQTVLIERREYLFPAMEPKLVFDVGANIGVVSVILANIYPKATICAFEPVKENYDLLVENTSHYKNVAPYHCGLGDYHGTEKIYKSDDPKNLGGFSNHIKGEEGETVNIVDMGVFCEKVGTPEIIKIDCEGAEYDILNRLGREELAKVKWITGELHGVKDFRLLDLLSESFKIQTQRNFDDKVWHFNAASR